MKAIISADDLAKDVAGAEALLERHQEHKVSGALSASGMIMIIALKGAIPSTKTECDYLSSLIKTKHGHIRKNLTQNREPQRSSWGMQKKKKGAITVVFFTISSPRRELSSTSTL